MSQQYIGTIRLGVTQNVAYTGTAGTISNGIGSGVTKVRVVVTTDAFVVVDKANAATSAGAYVVALTPEYFSVRSGEKVSAIQVASGGTLYVTEAN